MKYDVDARKDPYCNVSDFFELPRPPDVEQASLNTELKEAGECFDRAKTLAASSGEPFCAGGWTVGSVDTAERAAILEPQTTLGGEPELVG